LIRREVFVNATAASSAVIISPRKIMETGSTIRIRRTSVPRIILIAAVYLLAMNAAQAQEKGEIERLNAHFAELFNKGDEAGVTAMYTNDAVVLPPGAGIVKGRNDIQAFWKKAAETLGDMKLTTVDVKPLGGTAARETGHFSLKTKTTPSQEVVGKYVVVWEKVGPEWKLGADIWNDGK
jgi:ketosteroid isomerase-like protein